MFEDTFYLANKDAVDKFHQSREQRRGLIIELLYLSLHQQIMTAFEEEADEAWYTYCLTSRDWPHTWPKVEAYWNKRLKPRLIW